MESKVHLGMFWEALKADHQKKFKDRMRTSPKANCIPSSRNQIQIHQPSVDDSKGITNRFGFWALLWLLYDRERITT